MTRSLLVVGCREYADQNLLELGSAELDAKKVFNALSAPNLGFYTKERSALLLSPTRIELEDALKTVLFSDPRPDVFTFYFAGHGETANQTFYLCCKDAVRSQLSLTAVSSAYIFLAISERKPLQANIIIDACRPFAFDESSRCRKRR
jgi:hypothetical protein